MAENNQDAIAQDLPESNEVLLIKPFLPILTDE
jgi:hypothetical protein